MSFKIDEFELEKNKFNFSKFLQNFVGFVQSIFIIALTIMQINQLNKIIWNVLGGIAVGFMFLFGVLFAIGIISIIWDWITKHKSRKKLKKAHYSHLESRINYTQLEKVANEEILKVYPSALEPSIFGPDYFGYNIGLLIEIKPYSLEFGKLKEGEDCVPTWLCQYDKEDEYIIIRDLNRIKEIVVDRPLLSSIEKDEWAYTLDSLTKRGWEPLVLQSYSKTPEHRFVKFCLTKNDELLYVFKACDLPLSVIEDRI